jgi:hypothetical protein
MADEVGRLPNGRMAPGHSLNPSGRPKAFREYQQWLEQHALEPAKTALLRCLDDPDGRVVMMAVKEVADRLFGKAPQPVTGEDGKPITLAIGAELVHALRRLGGG